MFRQTLMLNQHRYYISLSIFRTSRLDMRLFHLRIFITHLVLSPYTSLCFYHYLLYAERFTFSNTFINALIYTFLFTHSRATSPCYFLLYFTLFLPRLHAANEIFKRFLIVSDKTSYFPSSH